MKTFEHRLYETTEILVEFFDSTQTNSQVSCYQHVFVKKEVWRQQPTIRLDDTLRREWIGNEMRVNGWAYRLCSGGWLWSEDGFDIMDIQWVHRKYIHRIEGLAVCSVRLNHIWSFKTGLV